MTATNHALGGIAIAVGATLVHQSWLALPLALVSHFALDALPHWNYDVDPLLKIRVALADVGFGTALALLAAISLYLVPAWLIIICALVAMAPDAMWLPNVLRNRPLPLTNPLLFKTRSFHRWIQWRETNKGIYLEAAWFLLLVALILVLNNKLTG